MKKLTPLHKEAIRRLVTGQKPGQIANELKLAEATILMWQKEPLFLAELHDLEDGVKGRLRERLTAMEKLEEASGRAVDVCVGAVDGKIGEDSVPVKMRLDAAFDLLNRIGVNRTKKAHVDSDDTMADLIIDAYHKGQVERENTNTQDKPSEPSGE